MDINTSGPVPVFPDGEAVLYKDRKRLRHENIRHHSPVERRPGMPAAPFEHGEVSRGNL